MRRCHALARTRGYVDHQTRLVAVFSRGRPGDHLNRLNGIQRDLIGKDFALLVGDGLAVNRERIFRMIAETVE